VIPYITSRTNQTTRIYHRLQDLAPRRSRCTCLSHSIGCRGAVSMPTVGERHRLTGCRTYIYQDSIRILASILHCTALNRVAEDRHFRAPHWLPRRSGNDFVEWMAAKRIYGGDSGTCRELGGGGLSPEDHSRGGGDQLGRSVVIDPALSGASATGWRVSLDQHSFLWQ